MAIGFIQAGGQQNLLRFLQELIYQYFGVLVQWENKGIVF
jgi:hypothetical protein